VSPLDEATLQQGLRQLVEAELVYQRGMPPQATYMFKHALIQEAAYQSLLRSTRQQVHQRIAQVLETLFPALVETQPELVAQHYTAAGCPEQAVVYWQWAGEHASNRSAHLEAISHVTTGIELLTTLPETPEHTQQALTLHIALSAALLVTKGHTAPEVEQAYTQARALCQQVGETPELVPVLFGLWGFYIMRPQLHTARELGDSMLRLAQPAHDPALSVIAHWALGLTWLWLGVLPAARQHLEEVIACYTPDQRRMMVFRTGRDPGVACRLHAALTLWLLGYPAQALVRVHDALALAHELSHPYSLGFARVMRPSSRSCAATCWPYTSRQRRLSHFICDFSPPRGAGPEGVAPAREIEADYICVAYNPGKAVRVDSAAMAAAIKREVGREVVFNLATRNMNKLALQSHLLGPKCQAWRTWSCWPVMRSASAPAPRPLRSRTSVRPS
jgi:hypothetical protein